MASFEGRVTRLEVAMADTKEWVDMVEHSMEKAVEDLKVQIQDLQEDMQGSPVPLVSHEEFTRVLEMLASLESRVEVLTKHDEELRQEVAIYKTALSVRVMAAHEAPRVEVLKPHTFSGQRDAKEIDNYLWHIERYFEAIGSKMRQPRYELLLFTSSIMQHYGSVESSWRWKGRCAL